MIVVIQCAASKRPEAGHLCTKQGRPVLFVADPAKAPPRPDLVYARPDDASDRGPSWRALLQTYNQPLAANPQHLLPAIELYRPPAYRRLAKAIGRDRTYILSAGWGLLAADWLTPAYDITFSRLKPADRYRLRDPRDAGFLDQAPAFPDNAFPILFLGGQDYVPLFCRLTQAAGRRRIIAYRAKSPPPAPNCRLLRVETRACTNWHYEAVQWLLTGKLSLGEAVDAPTPQPRLHHDALR